MENQNTWWDAHAWEPTHICGGLDSQPASWTADWPFSCTIWWWPINHRTRLVLKLTSLRKRRKLFSFPWRTEKTPVHLFATKLVHIQHYGLKIGGLDFWSDSAYFLISKRTWNRLNEVQNSRDVFFLKKKPPAGQNRDNEDWRTEFVSTRIPKSLNPRSRISKSQKFPNPQNANLEVCNPGWTHKLSHNQHFQIVAFWKVSELANSKLSNWFAAVYGPILN